MRYLIEAQKAAQDGLSLPPRTVTASAETEDAALSGYLALTYPVTKSFLGRPGDRLTITLLPD